MSNNRTLTTVSEPKCWIYMNMPKAGGTTIKEQMQARWGKKFHKYGNPEWKGMRKSGELLLSTRKVLGGHMVEGLRLYGGNKCRWFTVFRHPVPRLVSAYYWCKDKPRDPICAESIVSAKRVDFHTFAKHWGNFGLRSFTVSHVDPPEAMR